MKKITTHTLLMFFMVFAAVADQSIKKQSISRLQQQAQALELIIKQDNIDKNHKQIYQQQLYQLNQKIPHRGPAGAASIQGILVDNSAAAVSDHLVSLYQVDDQNQTFLTSVNTDATGNYIFNGLAAGRYAVLVGSVFDDYLDYVWQSAASGGPHLCSGCRFPVDSHFDLADAQVLNDINFTITEGGQINGILTDAITMDTVSTLLPQLVEIDTYNEYALQALFDDSTGTYSIKGIPDGNYRMYLRQNFGIVNNYIPQVYGGPECNSCSRIISDGIGSLLTINSANTLNNIDFSLNIGASISGKVVDAISLDPLQELALVMIFDQLNQNLASFIMFGTNSEPMADGEYKIGGLLPGSYYIQGGDLGREFYQRELFANKPCYWSGCDRGADGDAVVLLAGENRVGVNFLLEVGGKISGSVTDESTGMPISLANFENLWLAFYNDQEEVIGGAAVKPDGTYVSSRGLPAGNYAVRTGSMFNGELSGPYVNEKYNDVTCPGLACDLSTQDVNVVVNAETTNIDFALTTGFSFAGTITDLNTGLPIPNVNVLVYKDMGPGLTPKFANWATTSDGTDSPEGTFEVQGLPAGTYYAVTNNGSNLPFNGFRAQPGAGWVDILYNSMPCPAAGCDIVSGTPIILPAPAANSNTNGSGSTTIDFTLSQGANISGKVINFNDSAPIKEITINVFDQQGNSMGSFSTDENGEYRTAGFAAGTYYMTTTSFEVLVDVKYGNETCDPINCNPLDGTAIILAEKQALTDINFTLKPNSLFGNSFE